MTEVNAFSRLNEFRESVAASKNAFETKCELPKGYMSGKNSMPSVAILSRVHEQYPDLNMNWLLFGEGDMLLSQQPSDSGQAPDSTTATDRIMAEYLQLLKDYKSLQDKYAAILEQNTTLNIKTA